MPPSSSPAGFFLLLLLLLALSPPPTAAAKSRRDSTTAATAFGRAAWVENLTLLGSASILPGETAVALTTNSSDGIGAGRALFAHPVGFLLPPPNPRAAPAQASFSTRFTFRILPSPSYGDGLAFILTSSPTFLGASNGFLGLYPSAPSSGDGELADVYTVAIELDTHRDVALRDPDGNHIALDAGSIFSIASASPGLNLKAGVPMTAWVEYRAPRHRLRAWLSYSSSRRPAKSALSVEIDLSGILQGRMFTGFSASNGEGSALHVVDSWTFNIYWSRSSSHGLASTAPAPQPSHTPSNTSPQPHQGSYIPLPLPTDHQHRRLKTIVALVCGIILLVALSVLICWLCVGHHRKTRSAIQLTIMSYKRRILPNEVPRSV